MRKDTSSSSAKLELLLKDLEKLQSITQDTLLLVKQVLGQNAEATMSRKATSATPRPRTKTKTPAVSPDVTARHALRIVKACLGTLKQAVEASVKHGKSAQSTKTPHNTHTLLAAQICLVALESWTKDLGPDLDAKRKLDIVLVRSNLTARLLDHKLLDLCQPQLGAIHQSTCELLHPMHARSSGTVASWLCYPIDDVPQGMHALVVSSQLQILRFMCESDFVPSSDAFAILDGLDGPIALCRKLQRAEAGSADRHLEYLHRAIFTLSSRDLQTQLQWQLLALDCLCSQASPDIVSCAKLFAKCLPAKCNILTLDRAEALAAGFLAHADLDDRLKLVLRERMANLMKMNDEPGRATAWVQALIHDTADKGPDVAYLLEAAILDLDQAKSSDAQSAVLVRVENVLKTSSTNAPLGLEVARRLIKAVNSVRKSLQSILQAQTDLATSIQNVLELSLVLLRYNKDTLLQLPGCTATIEALINALVSCTVARADAPAELHSLFERLLSFADDFQIDSVKPRIWTQCWNIGGSLLSKGQHQAAADFLILATQWSTVAQDARKLQFVWSCLFHLQDYELAAKWLLTSLLLFANESTLLSMNAAAGNADYAEICIQFPEISRVLQKLASVDIAIGRTSLSGLFTSDQALIIHDLSFFHLWQQRSSARSQSPLYKQAAACILPQSEGDIVRLSRFGQNLSLAMACAVDLEDETWCVELQNKRAAFTLSLPLKDFRSAFVLFRLDGHDALKAYDSPETTEKALASCEYWLSLVATAKPLLLHQAEEALSLLLRMSRQSIEQEQPLNTLQLIGLISQVRATYKMKPSLSSVQIELEFDLFAALLECGLSHEAGLVLTRLAKAQQSAEFAGLAIRLQAAHVRVEICHGDLDAAQTRLGEIKRLPRAGLSSVQQSTCALSILLASSELAEAQGCMTASIQFELEALSIFRRQVVRAIRKDSSRSGIPNDELIKAMESLSVEDAVQMDHSRLLSNAMHRLAVLHGRCGFLRDASYYANQSFELAQRSGLAVLQSRAKLLVQLFQVRSGRPLEVLPDRPHFYGSMKDLQSLLYFAEISETTRDFQTAIDALDGCLALVKRLPQLAANPRAPSSRDKHLKSKKAKDSTACFDHGSNELIAAAISRRQTLLTLQDDSTAHRNSPVVLTADLYAAVSQYSMAQRLLESDPVYGVLHDSALSLPSVCSTVARTKGSAHRNGRSSRSASGKETPALDEIRALLQKSKMLVAGSYEDVFCKGESYAAHEYGTLFANLNLFHSAMVTLTDLTVRPAACNYFLESSRAVSMTRELERRRFQPRAAMHAIPEGLFDVVPEHHLPQKEQFSSNYIDNIPDNWSVVSIGLGADKADLIMSRLQANKTPLILRLPLSRHNSRDMDEETFEFEAARQELADIVKTSNDSAQAAKNIIGKQAKLEWWELRKSLDERLRTLLFNMERCWLGGFRGLLGRSKHDSAAFDQFKSSFAKIMMTYVPFRSNRSFDIDTRILDLFVDLGSIDQDELLELLEDLLYFILDIYQFHGESIAYDEIDIDRMTVDIQTALNAFHERAAPAVSDAHTILILDKELSEFPWESTNCLRGLSVSRVPSLAALKGMLDAHGAQPQSSAVGGRYILNPSQDLKQTEVFFHERLQSLPDWQGITSRVPEEAEVLDYLGQGSIYIYFGHGGGEQYVRASKLKQLPKTALAILMGCSSGALRDQGLYDRWGTPYNYLVAGSPCVLANLWDVTDKDIDRFSEKVLTLWGLFASTDSQQSPVKGKRRQALQKPQDFQGMSLPLAVSQSRDECVMPYLNGAAPVVYGLPVHLKF